jgi:YHS domain-containing protein
VKEKAMDRRSLVVLFAISAFAPLARAGKPEVFTGLAEGFGAGGYDVVSYFSGKAMAGTDAFTMEWKGAKWRFVSAENLKAFQADPEKYAPQYGGYCAYAVAKGATAKGEPEVWSVVDGKLYLNFSPDIQAKWKTDVPGHISAANANWPKVLE